MQPNTMQPNTTNTTTTTTTPTPTPAPGLAACGQLLERVCRFMETGSDFDRTMTISSLQTVMAATGKRHLDPSEVAHLHPNPLSAVIRLIGDIKSGPCPHLAELFPEDDPLHDSLALVALALGVTETLTTRDNPHAL